MKTPASLLAWAMALYVVLGAHAVRAAEPTNSVTLQPWDYADQLDLTDAQKKSILDIGARYNAARAEVRRLSTSNTPPDLRLSAQLQLNTQTRVANRCIAELLTEKQKERLAELRPRPSRAPARETTTETSTETETDAVPSTPSRKPPRKLLSESEYRELAARLRQTYAAPSAQWTAPNIDDDVKPRYRELGLLPAVTFPTNNPYSDAKAELGRKLFFDPRLSGSGQVSCASCHDPDLAFADGRTVSFGHERKQLTRNAPTVANSAFLTSLFWDGRASSLEQQASDVVKNQDEMHSSAEFVQTHVGAIPAYRTEFQAVFGSPDVTLDRAAQAIATFERTVTSRASDFDSFLRGDTNSLSAEAIRGLHLFRTTARCVNCHFGPTSSDGLFHNEGLTYYGRKYEDLGRYRVTKDPADIGRFKTPTLRNITRTAPYMHNGLFELEGVLNMYNAGMPTPRRRADQKDDKLFPVKSPHLQSLGLNRQDLDDLKAFLESLAETRWRLRPPELPESASTSTP